MIKISLIVVFLGVLATSVAWMQQADSSDDHFITLLSESDTVVRGIIKTSTGVIRPEKANPQPDKSSNTLELPNLLDYRVGTIYRVEVIEVIKSIERSDEPSFLDVFVPGSFWKEGDPLLIEGQERVLFLQTFKDKEGLYSRTELLKPDQAGSTFVPQSYFVITRNAEGVFDVSKDEDILRKIKSITQ